VRMQCLSCVNAVPKLCEIVDLSKEIRTHNEVILEHIWLCEAIDLSKEIKAHNEVVLEYIWLCETRVPGELQKDQHSVPNELPVCWINSLLFLKIAHSCLLLESLTMLYHSYLTLKQSIWDYRYSYF
jgi:hypothetical protein